MADEVVQQQPQGDVSQGGGGGWRESLGEIGKEKSLDSFKGNTWDEVGPMLAKSYVEAQKMIGGSIRLPKPDAPLEERYRVLNDIYTKLGRPETYDKYKIPEIEGIQWDKTILNPVLEELHKIGFTQDQLENTLRVYAKVQKLQEERNREALNQKINEERNATVNNLKQKWGADFDRKMILAQRAVKEFGGDKLVALMQTTGLGNNEVLVNTFAEIGEILAEDGFIDGRIVGEKSLEDLKNELKMMVADKNHPLNNISHPLHKQAVENYNKSMEKFTRMGGRL